MKIVVSGASGLVGTPLVERLTSEGHEVARLVRGKTSSKAAEIPWDPANNTLDAAPLEGTNAVVHLAGENIASGRWTEAKKRRIRDSRIQGTRLLAETLAHCESPPTVFVSASAIGFYGNRGDEILTEQSAPGEGFLPDVCREWEAAAEPARQKGIRIVTPRIGVVISADGGALKKMLTPFSLGAGGCIGSGRQFMSWIALDDLVSLIVHAIDDESLSGPINTVAPNPVTNREFTKTLGAVLRRPTIFPIPATFAKLAFGELANDLLLGSQRVEPARLIENGFPFRFPELKGALRHVLGK